MEMKNCTHIRFLFCADILLIVCAAKECKYHTVSTQRRFNDEWDVFLFLAFIKVCQIFAGNFHMTGKVIVGSICNAP